MNTVCRRGETKTPCELFTGIVPDLLHITAFPIGTLALCPRVGKKQLLDSMNELVVVICPILTSKSYLVLKEGQSIPIVRSGLQEIYSPIPSLSEEELKLKAPVYNDKGRLIDFSSRKDVDFSVTKPPGFCEVKTEVSMYISLYRYMYTYHCTTMRYMCTIM